MNCFNVVSKQNAGFTYISFYLLAVLSILPLSPTVVFAVGNVVPVLISIFLISSPPDFLPEGAHAVILVASPFFSLWFRFYLGGNFAR